MPPSFRTEWSEEDREYVGLCDDHPGLSWLEKTEEEALAGIRKLVEIADEDIAAERFNRDAEAWLQKSQMMSSLTDMAILPEYQRIIGLGPVAVPLIIDRLRERPEHWFWALTSIVGDDQAAGETTVSGAALKWIEWYDGRRPVIGRGQFEKAPAEVSTIVPAYDRPRRRRAGKEET